MSNRSDETLLLGTVEEIVVQAGKSKWRRAKSHKVATPYETLSVGSSLSEFVDRAITPRKSRGAAAESKKRSDSQRRKVRRARRA